MRQLLLLLLPVAACMAAPDAAEDQLDFADGLFARRLYSMAVGEYQTFLSDWPEHPKADVVRLRLGEALYYQGKYAEALERFRPLASSGLGSADEAAFRVGACLYQLGQYEEAVRALSEFLSGAPPGKLAAAADYYLALSESASGRPQKAIEAYSRIVNAADEAGFAPYARLGIARERVALDQLEGAAEILAPLVSGDHGPEMAASALILLGTAYDDAANYAAAFDMWSQLVAGYSAHAEAKAARLALTVDAYRLGRFEGCRKAAAGYAGDYASDEAVPQVRYLAADCLYLAKDYEKAIGEYGALRKDHPKSPYARQAAYRTAWSHYLLGDYEAAAAQARALLSEKETERELREDARFLLGMCAYRAGRYDEAARVFGDVAGGSYREEAEYRVGSAHLSAGKNEEAHAAYTAFAQRRPASQLAPRALLEAADASARAGDDAALAADLRAVADKYPTHPLAEEALYRLAGLSYRLGGKPEMEEAYSRLIDAFPDSGHKAEAHYQLGWEAEQSGDLEAAERQYRLGAACESDESAHWAGLAYARLGAVLLRQGEEEEAAGIFLAIVRGEPVAELTATSALWLGGWLAGRQRYGEAQAAYGWLLDQAEGRDLEQALWGLAEANRRLDRHARARRLYERAVTEFPQGNYVAASYHGLGLLDAAAGNTEAAVANFRKAIARDEGPVAVRSQYEMGLALRSAGDYEQACKVLLAVDILYDYPRLASRALAAAAECFDALGQPDRASQTRADLLERFPDSEAARALGGGEAPGEQ